MFTEDEMAIYAYNNGSRDVRADPLALRRAIVLACSGDVNGMLDACQAKAGPDGTVGPAETMRVWEAREKMDAAIRQAFQLVPLDVEANKGCTEAMVRRIWADYCEWLAKKERAGADWPA